MRTWKCDVRPRAYMLVSLKDYAEPFALYALAVCRGVWATGTCAVLYGARFARGVLQVA